MASLPGFLDDRYIIMPGYHSPSGPGFLAVLDCRADAPKTYTSFSDMLDDAILVLDLPPLAANVRWVSLFMERSLQPTGTTARSKSIFSPCHDTGIMVVVLTLQKGEDASATQHLLVVSVATIRSRLLAATGSLELGLVSRCRWQKWGSETRYLPTNKEIDDTSVCSTRLAMPQEHWTPGDNKPTQVLEIFEFDNLPSILRDCALRDDPRVFTIVHQPTKFDPEFLDTDVETIMPYRHIVTKIVVPKGYRANIGEHSVIVHSDNNPKSVYVQSVLHILG